MNATSLLANEHVSHLLARARRLTRNDADAHDLVQDTCLQALEVLPRMDRQPDHLLAWLVTVMRNHWFNVVRHRKVRQSASTQLAHGNHCDSALYETRVVYPQLARAWGALSEQARTIAHQCLLDGDSHEEVSRRVGMTPGGVATSIDRTREHLRVSMFGA